MHFLFISLLILPFQIKGSAKFHSKIYDRSDTLKAWDVVINEIMADPDPVAGTIIYPEYVELYNKKNSTVQLKNWKFCIGANCKTLPDVSIPADSFLILTAPASVKAFSAGINVTGVTGFPALANAGQILQLQNDAGNIIHVVSYSDEWYEDIIKKEGGYSLEQMDATTPCAEVKNWKASVNKDGGTPGRRNSITTIHQDLEPPELLRVNVLAPDLIEAVFTESLDSTTLLSVSSYDIRTIGNPDSIHLIKPYFKSVVLYLRDSLKRSFMYTLAVGNQITDCVGNAMNKSITARFAIPETIFPNDIVINEVLFNPRDGGVDFVEIYNRSQKVLDLKTLFLCHYDTISNTVTGLEKITSTAYLFFPGEYLVLTEDAGIIKNQYRTENPRSFLNVDELPRLNAKEGNIGLKTFTEMIDHFTYNENMHFALLKDTRGISLERLNFGRFTNDVTNWHSASSSVDFATPGYRNSQYVDEIATDAAVKLYPEIFSPDEDGFQDQVTVQYRFDKPSLSATILIYDGKGRLVKTLVNNELIGTEGSYSWDGINDNREKERKGIYIIYMKIVDLSGMIKQYKKVCVLGGKN